MELDSPEAIDRIASWLTSEFKADRIEVVQLEKLSGGAIQENWALQLDIKGGEREGGLDAVLRTDSPSGLAVSHSRAQEYELLSAAFENGVTVPEPLACCRKLSVIGKEFAIMRRMPGIGLGPKVARDPSLGGDREILAERLGQELAKIHQIGPETHQFDFLEPANTYDSLESFYRFLDDLDEPRSALEWGLRWLELNRLPKEKPVLAHHDFRTGNYMVDEKGLTCILDWEFAGWAEPHEDIGWFTAMCWRFGNRDLPAGGIGSREAFYRGYEHQSGRKIDHRRVYFWEIFAHIRWAVIAIQQGKRFRDDNEATLDIVLTGRRPAEIEYEILRMTMPGTGLVAAKH